MAKRAQQTVLFIAAGVCVLLLAGAAILVYMSGSTSLSTEPPATPISEASVQPLDQSAEERAYEAIRKVPRASEAQEDTADADQVKAEPSQSRVQLANRAKHEVSEEHLSPTALALNCERLRKAYSYDQLKNIPGFKEKCEG